MKALELVLMMAFSLVVIAVLTRFIINMLDQYKRQCKKAAKKKAKKKKAKKSDVSTSASTSILVFVILLLLFFGVWCVLNGISWKHGEHEEQRVRVVEVVEIHADVKHEEEDNLPQNMNVNYTHVPVPDIDCGGHLFPPPSRVELQWTSETSGNTHVQRYHEYLHRADHQIGAMRTALACPIKKYFMDYIAAGKKNAVLHFRNPAESEILKAQETAQRILLEKEENKWTVLTSSNVGPISAESCSESQHPYNDGSTVQRKRFGQCFLLFVHIAGGSSSLYEWLDYKWSCGANQQRYYPTVEFCGIPDLDWLRNNLDYQMHPLAANWNQSPEYLERSSYIRGLHPEIREEWLENARVINFYNDYTREQEQMHW